MPPSEFTGTEETTTATTIAKVSPSHSPHRSYFSVLTPSMNIFTILCQSIFLLTHLAGSISGLPLIVYELIKFRDYVRECITFTCVLLRYRSLPQVIVKSAFSTTNLVLSVYFFVLLPSTATVTRREPNNVVATAIVVEFITSALPNYVGVIINLITLEPSGNFFGPTTTMSCALEAAVCSVLYTWILMRCSTASRPPHQIMTATADQKQSNNCKVITMTWPHLHNSVALASLASTSSPFLAPSIWYQLPSVSAADATSIGIIPCKGGGTVN